MFDPFLNHAIGRDSPGMHHAAIAPSNTKDIPIRPRGLYCQTAGSVTTRDESGTDVTLCRHSWPDPAIQPGAHPGHRHHRDRCGVVVMSGIGLSLLTTAPMTRAAPAPQPWAAMDALLTPGATRLATLWPAPQFWFSDAVGLVPWVSGPVRGWRSTAGTLFNQPTNADFAPGAGAFANGKAAQSYDGVDDVLTSTVNFPLGPTSEYLHLGGVVVTGTNDATTYPHACGIWTGTPSRLDVAFR